MTSWSSYLINHSLGSLTQYAIEKPFTTPISAAISITQITQQPITSSFKQLARSNALYRSLIPSIISSIPTTISELTLTQLLNKTKLFQNSLTTKKLLLNIGSTITIYPFTRYEILQRTSFSLQRQPTIIQPLFWNILRNASYLLSTTSVNSLPLSSTIITKSKKFTRLLPFISTVIGTTCSYPFDVLMCRSLHNLTTPYATQYLYNGYTTELCKNILLQVAHQHFISQIRTQKKHNKAFQKKLVFPSICYDW
ncbi:Mitochondrial carrier protein [Entamoeba marina]